jgi:hypothetical protein
MGTVSDDRGPEEISVLAELEVQQWVDEALRNAARATERILDRIASLGVRRPDQDCVEASDFDLADSKAAQTVMRTVTAYPLNDMQLERIVKLALGKRVLEATTATADGGPPRAATSVARTVDDSQTRPEAMSDDGARATARTPRSLRSHHLQTGRRDPRRQVQKELWPREAQRHPPRSNRSRIRRAQR